MDFRKDCQEAVFRYNIIISVTFVDNVTSRYDVIILDVIIVRHYRNYVVKQQQRKTMVRNDKKEREKEEGRIKRKGKKGKIYTTDDGTILTNR